ncbi:hypothetical protein BA724_15445 [Domibacillus iocasae]|uniref:Uncharacterized protein n=1 Tax=Domibacillus iocasae TaxID=1714016 RepID=A0A1E7DT87_9BACI|nr:hypothetical protein BA724_15445 [Domibacillus iocasae]
MLALVKPLGEACRMREQRIERDPADAKRRGSTPSARGKRSPAGFTYRLYSKKLTTLSTACSPRVNEVFLMPLREK